MMLRNEKDPASGLVGRVTIEVTVDRDFPEKYLTTLKSVIDQCTVKKQLLNPPEFEILINGPP
jgi:putative redox protein